MKQILQLLVLSFFPLLVFSQTAEEKKEITKFYNIEKLEEIANDYKLTAEAEKSRALAMAQQKGWSVRYEEDNVLYELMRLSEADDPLYYATNNVNAAISTRANTLHNGGLLGMNVEGQNMEAHVWDGGLARTTHQEYDGIGGSNRFSIGDGTTTLHYHSAHVTGTIIASGYSANAKGMAPQASAIGYEWNNDEYEATTAAGTGMLLSNHSYGWGASSIPDWYFGAYHDRSRAWDVIMNNAPYYLMVCSAGNDGNDNSSNGLPLDGQSAYDKLSGFKTSKNNVVVANGNDASIDPLGNLISVVISSSSSEGPCDDYRIKPDITGNGTSVYSSYEGADNEYGTISGTSMASPGVCGALLLLQQHYNDLNSGFMRAATLKGLALHTADDAGSSGPDVVYGWGLINAKAAVQTINTKGAESTISEINLSNGGSYSISVDSDGTNPLIASICWNDPAGTANTGTANDPTPVLVNDLDIRVTKGGTTYYPYKLTSVSTNTTGDNLVDPYEKIIINGASGTYTITVSHKGTLSGGSQNFSLIVTGQSSIPTAPVANFSADDLTPMVGQTVNIADLSTNIPTSWAWSFNPATVTYVGGTSSSSQNPKVTFDAAGVYSVTLTATNALGSDSEIKTNYIDAFDCTVSNFPYTESFDSWSASAPDFACTADGSVTLGDCWTNVAGDNIDWDVLSGSTGSSNTGPTGDHTGSGNYLYTESSSCFNTTGYITSPEFDFSSLILPQLSFWYHMYGTSMGSLSVQVSTNGGVSWSSNVWSLSGDQGNSWVEAVVDLSAYASQSSVIIRWTGATGSSYTSDMAIDDVAVADLFEAEMLWTGVTNTDWNTTSNWSSNSLPISANNITIPGSPSGGKFPETNTGAGAVFNNLTIQAGAHVHIPSNNTLTVYGTITNNAGASGLVIKSTANNATGSLIHNTAGVNATVEKYLTEMKWHFIGMPVESEVAGVFHLPAGHSDIYLRTHVEATNTWDDFIVPIGTPLTLGRGYECWVHNNGAGTDEIVEFQGVMNTGDYTTGSGGFYDLQYTTGHGLNLISNPYPSALIADIDGWSKTNIDNSVWTWDGVAGNYVYWNGTDGSGGGTGVGSLTGGIIPSMQAFFVLANGPNPSITIPQSGRVHSSQAYYKTSGQANTIRLDVEGNGFKDVVFVNFKEGATQGYDGAYDVKKIYGLEDAPQLYSMTSSEKLSVNALPELLEYEVVNLGFECNLADVYTINASEIESFNGFTTIYIEDTKEDILFNLSDNPSYTFTHQVGDDLNRFNLHFGSPDGLDESAQSNVKIFSFEDFVYVQQPQGWNSHIIIYDMLGHEIKSERVVNQSMHKIQVTNGSGYYLVKVLNDNQIVTEKVFIK